MGRPLYVYSFIEYKLNVLAALKDAGYTTYWLRQEKIIGERMIQKLRENKMVSWEILARICAILKCQPGDLIQYVKK